MKVEINHEEEVKSAIEPVRQAGSELPKRQTGLYTIRDLMSLFGVCRRTISNWQASGRLSYVKIGNLLYVTQKQLEEFLTDHEVTAYKRYGRVR
jgi:hypothetical protein